MKAKSEVKLGTKLLSCLLALTLTLSMAPGAYAAGTEAAEGEEQQSQEEPFAEQQALLDELSRTATEPGTDNVEQSNTTWRFGGRDYRVIYNDYIACYASLDDGSFTILPATAAFDPSKPASHASFVIDGESYVFGEIRGNIDLGDGTIFIPPVVEKDMISAHYAVGDYVISQYLAITEDASHENAYAIKIGYGAEYFGSKSSTISGEIVIDTLLGADDSLALTTEDGSPLTAGEELAIIPDSLMVPQNADGGKAFFVLREENGTAPGTLIYDDLTRLVSDEAQAEVPATDNTDSAIKLCFEPLTTNGAPTVAEATEAAEAEKNDIAIFNTNYGFYDLVPAEIDLEPAPESAATSDAEPGATSDTTSDVATQTLGPLATEQGAHRLYCEVAEPNSITMVTQLPKDENDETYVNVGDEISFAVNLINDGRIASRLEVSYDKAVNGAPEQEFLNLTPGENGIYTFKVPTDIYVSTQNPSSNGQIGIGIFSDIAEGAVPIIVNNSASSAVGANVTVSSGGIDVGHNRAALADDTITVVLERLIPDRAPVLEKFVMINYDAGPDTETTILPTSTGSDTYTYTVPSYTGNVGLHIEIDSTDRGEYIINKKIIASDPSGIDFEVQAKGDSDIAFAPIAFDAGLLRATSGDSIKILASSMSSWLSDVSVANLTAVNLSTGTQIGSIVNLKDSFSEFTFTMPSANVELVLNLTLKPRVTTQVVYPAGDSVLGSGASLTASPVADNGDVTLNIDLFGGGYKLNGTSNHQDGDVGNYLKVYTYKPDGTLKAVANPSFVSNVYQQSYTYQTTQDIAVELVLEKTPDPPTMQTIATMPFVGEGQTIYNINYWVSRSGSSAIDAANEQFKAGTALDEAGKTMKAAVGSPIMFYASKPGDSSGLEAWELQRVYIIVGEGANVVEHVYGDTNDSFIGKNGDAYSFTMPDAPVTIAVEAQKSNARGQVVTETTLLVNGEEYPYTEQGGAGNLQAYKLNGSTMEKVDAVSIGDQIFIAAYPMLGGSLKSITVEQEGYAPLDIRGGGSYNQQLNTDVYSFKALRGSVFKVKAVYEATNKTRVLIMGHENDADLEFIGERSRDLFFGQIYDPNATERGLNVASTIIELKTTDEHIGDYVYTLSEAANASYGADDIILELIEYKDGYARYELTVSATSSKMPVELYVEKSDYSRRPVITGMTANHLNRDKFNNLIITGENLRNLVQAVPYDYRPNIFLQQNRKGGETLTYKVPRESLQPNAAGTEATLALRSADLTLVSPETAAEKPEFATGYDYAVQIEWYWGDELGPMTLSDTTRTSWTLNDASFDFKPNAEYCYAAVGLLDSFQFSYGVVAGETMDAVKNSDAFSETYVSFECKGGFSIATAGGQTKLTLKDPNSPVLVNGILTLEPSGASGTPFSLTQKLDSDGALYEVTLSTNQKLVAKGTTLYSPVGSMGTLAMNFESGKYYSATEEILDTPQIKGKSLPTFVPQGDITVDVLGYNGFSAQYDSIKMLPKKLQLAGGLLLQVPGIEMPLAGLNLENLQLNLENASPGFDGIRADGEVGGSFAIITLQGKGEVDTFNNYYRFEGEVEVPVFEARGYLELLESKRFRIPMLEEFHLQVAGDKGIPLVPPVTVGYLNGFEGGVYGLSSTLDYDPTDPTKPILPPLRIAGGARFQLLELVEFWVELTAGPAYFKQSLHDAYINLKGINFQIIEELTMEIGVFEDHPRGERSRTVFGYNGRLRANLLKGIISDVFIAEGNLNVNASMDHPSYWLAKKDTYTDVLTLLNAINARFSASGNIDGILQVPKFTLLNTNYGPFKIAEAGAWFDARIPLSSRIHTTCFRVGGNLSWGPVGIEVEYDFMQPASPPDFSFELFSADGTAVPHAVYAQAFGDGSSGGSIVIGEGMRVAADSFGEMPTQSAEGLGTLDLPHLSTGASISVYGDRDSFIHTITVPDGTDKSYWIQAAGLVAGDQSANLNLTLYDPDGKPVALKPIPYNAESTAEQGEHGYNALRSQDGSGMLICLDEPGEYKLTSNSEFRSWVMDADAKPEITKSGLAGDWVSFKAENLENGARYFYRVMLEQKDVYNGDAESALVLQEEYFTATSASFTKDLPLADYNLNESLESGNYIPTILLYEVTAPDDPVTEADEEVRTLVSTGEIYTPIAVTNTRASAIAPGALGDLAVASAGNESINLKFSSPTVDANFGRVPDDGDGTTNENENQPNWQPAYYQVDLYDETGKLATRAVDEGGAQVETALSYVISEAEKEADGSLDVLLAGIPGGHTYTVEVTPIFTSTYEMPAAIQETMQEAMQISTFAEGSTGSDAGSMELQQQGVVVSRSVNVPDANPPQLTLTTSTGTQGSVNGTTTYYLSANSSLDITTDQSSDIMVRKYSSAATAPVLKAATATTSLQLTSADFADRTDEVVSAGLFAITAKNAAGDTTMELVNIVIDTTAPFLLIDDLTEKTRSAANGTFAIVGSTEPHAQVISSLGHSATSDANGRFTLRASLDAKTRQEEVFITTADLAGNTTTESLILTRENDPKKPDRETDATGDTGITTSLPRTGDIRGLQACLAVLSLALSGLLCTQIWRKRRQFKNGRF